MIYLNKYFTTKQMIQIDHKYMYILDGMSVVIREMQIKPQGLEA